MKRLLVASIALAALLAAGCGNDYAAQVNDATHKWGAAVLKTNDPAKGVDALDDLADDLDALEPPDEAKGEAEALVNVVRSAHDSLDDLTGEQLASGIDLQTKRIKPAIDALNKALTE
jgi:hypothetical protein